MVRRHRQTDAGTDVELQALNLEGFLNRLGESVGNHQCGFAVGNVGENEGKLVTTQTGYRIPRPQRRLQPAPDLNEE